MSTVHFMSIASGSKGNSYYLATPHSQVLIDCGVGIRRLTSDLASRGIDYRRLDAVFVTHTHTDHVNGIGALLAKVPLRVYCHERAAVDLEREIRTTTNGSLRKKLFNNGSPVPIDIATFNGGDGFPHRDIDILPVRVSHDSEPTVAYKLFVGKLKIGILTDLGTFDNHIVSQFSDCDLLMIESNHCLTMLSNGPYPEILKQRIRGQRGHLSNDQAVQFVTGLNKRPRHLVLGHLSENNNTPHVVTETFNRVETGRIPHIIAGQYDPGPILELSP